ncbi:MULTISPECIES: thioesterase II family protein [unclassified Streptomyces]|uniref:thioesterase II family protein n=1 Tax=unclassified Streptomyces TaxID=2593676 RepID=UPI0038258F66
MPSDPTPPVSPVASRTFYVPERCREALAIVYGVGNAGSGAAPWKTVAARLAPTVETRAYRLPGRENRLRDPAHTTLVAAAAELAAAVLDDVGNDARPFLLAGVCSGALIGRVALTLIARDAPDVLDAALGLVVIDQTAPTTPIPELSTLPTPGLRQWLREHHGTPTEVLDNDKLFAFFEPTLRTDLRMAETYVHEGEPLTTPLILVRAAGQTDLDIDLAPWRTDTAGSVLVMDAAGPVGTPTTHPAGLAEVLRQALDAVMPLASVRRKPQ